MDEMESGLTADVVKHKISTYSSSITFTANWGEEETEHTYSLDKEVSFVTAHPCAPSQYVKYVKSPSSPTIQQIDVSGQGMPGKVSTVASVTGMSPLLPCPHYAVSNTSQATPYISSSPSQ